MAAQRVASQPCRIASRTPSPMLLSASWFRVSRAIEMLRVASSMSAGIAKMPSTTGISGRSSTRYSRPSE